MLISRVGLAVLVALVGATGCVAKIHDDGHGTTNHVIIGFGIVRTAKADESSAMATDVESVGVALSNSPAARLVIGAGTSTVTTVPEGTNAIIEVSRRPFAPLIIRSGNDVFVPSPDQTNSENVK